MCIYKQYLTVAEYATRFEIFKKNIDEIKNSDETDLAYYGVNQFTDRSEEEFMKLLGAWESYAGRKRNLEEDLENWRELELSPNDISLDWRNNITFNPIKD